MTLMSARKLLFTAFMVASLGLIGCGQSKKVPTYPVAGKVLLGGKPLAHAIVVLHPDGGEPNADRPRATTDSDGSFTIQTTDGQDGAPAGTYRITVEQWLASKRTDEGPSNRLPAKYAKPESSGLTATIVPGPNELQPIVLKK
jgi:hypothetical protein